MMLFVTDECRRLGLRAGALVFRNIRVESRNLALTEAIRQEARLAQLRYAGPTAIRALPEVAAFRELLRRVGANPRRDQPSVERLLGFALKRGDLPDINSLVDAYNLVSIRSLCSLGAHDLDRIDLPVSLQILTGSEPFTPLGTDRPTSIQAGEFGYVDARGRVLCRLDVMQADFSKVTAATKNVILIVEGSTAHKEEQLRHTVEDAITVVKEYCSGTAEIVARPGK